MPVLVIAGSKWNSACGPSRLSMSRPRIGKLVLYFNSPSAPGQPRPTSLATVASIDSRSIWS